MHLGGEIREEMLVKIRNEKVVNHGTHKLTGKKREKRNNPRQSQQSDKSISSTYLAH
jgi:hypothetical protein